MYLHSLIDTVPNVGSVSDEINNVFPSASLKTKFENHTNMEVILCVL